MTRISDPAGFIQRAITGESVDWHALGHCVHRCGEELHDARNEDALVALVRLRGHLTLTGDLPSSFDPAKETQCAAAEHLLKALGMKHTGDVRALATTLSGRWPGVIGKLISEQEERWKR